MKIADEPSELQPDVNLRRGVERTSPNICPDDDENPSDDEECDEKIPLQEFTNDENVPSEIKEEEHGIMLQIISNEEDILSEEEEVDTQNSLKH